MDADIQIHALHILRNYIVPLFYQSVCLCHADECDHTSRADAQFHKGMHPCLLAQADGIAHDILCHLDGGEIVLHLHQTLGIADRLDLMERIGIASGVQNLDLILAGRIADGKLYHKTIQLGFRQRMRTGCAQRVLRCDADKRTGQRMGHAVYGHVLLFHGLQKRRLGFR